MAKSAPRRGLSHRLVAALERLDDGSMPLAELRRLVGAEAERLGLSRPSYERVRVVAHEARARRAVPSTTEVLLDVAWRARRPEAVPEHIAGTLPAR